MIEDTLLDSFEMSVRAANVCGRAKITTLGDLAAITERQLWMLHGCGRGTAKELEILLHSNGLTFAREAVSIATGLERYIDMGTLPAEGRVDIILEDVRRKLIADMERLYKIAARGAVDA